MSCQVIQTPAPYAKSLGIPKNTESRKALNMLAAVLLCLAVLLAGTAASPSDAYAADTRKGYTIAVGSTQVYSNTALTKKYGVIFASDEVTVLEVTSKYTKVRYPLTKGGWKTGYVRTSSLLTATSGKTYKSTGKFTTYKRPGGATYGYVAKSDPVLVLDTKEKYTQIKYPVSGGYKYAFALTTDINKYLKGQSTTAAPKKSTSTQKPISVVTTGKAQSTTTSFRMPVDQSYVCGNNWGTYSAKCGSPGRRTHCGIDIKSRNGNTTVYAVAAGTVAGTGYNKANGNYVVIKHVISGKTVYSFYAHLKKTTIKNGAKVSTGTAIGVIGNTGSSSKGVHLHFTFADKYKAGSYYGYVSSFSGNKTTYGGVTFYNPNYVIPNKRLP